MSFPRPVVGVPQGLVYRECLCGEWCATGEGAYAPRCGVCRGPMMPAGPGMDERRLHGLGFIATLKSEMAAFQEQLAREDGHEAPYYDRDLLKATVIQSFPDEA